MHIGAQARFFIFNLILFLDKNKFFIKCEFC